MGEAERGPALASESATHRYEYQFDPNGDTAGARLVRMVGRRRKVLELGAGPGSITRHLAANDCAVTAVEKDPTAIEKLRRHCGCIHTDDLNDPGWAGRVGAAFGQFDIVMAADVLEHLEDPGAVLSAMVGLLAPGGSILLSLPHVCHIALLASLLQDDFAYAESGLLDRTHIRFFGLRNMQALHEAAGLAIVEAEFVLKAPGETEFKEKWDTLDAGLQRALSAQRYGHVYQVVSRAQPAALVARPVDLLSLVAGSPDAVAPQLPSGEAGGLSGPPDLP